MGPVLEAAKVWAGLANQCQFVLGDYGTNSAEWREEMSGLPNVYFSGLIDRPKIEALARRSIAELPPYRNSEDFDMSLTNNVIDFLAFGLPVLTPLRGEVLRLVSEAHVALSYGQGSGMTLAQRICNLTTTPGLRERLSRNALGIYEAQFSFEKIYGGLVPHLEMLEQCRD